MAEEKQIVQPETKEAAKVKVTPAPAPVPEKDDVKKPIEISSAQNGIRIRVVGDHVTLELSQYLAEHIGQFRSCKKVVAKFKHGAAPDITAYREQG